jgi:tetratricopeptide (TPR) repeat protein
MYLFPSYFYHRTIPFESDGQRISIAFDILPEYVGDDAPELRPSTLPTATQELMRKAWELSNDNRVKEADELCRQVLEQVPKAHEAWYLRSMIAWKTSDVISAESHMRRAIELCPDEADYWFDFGWCLRIMQRSAEALEAYEKGLSIKPDNADAYINVAALLTDMNRNDEGRAAYREAIRLKPANGTAYYGLALMTRFKEGDPEIPAMERLLDQVAEMGERDRSNLFFALGKAADNLGDYDKAFEYYAEGNRIKRISVKFDVAEDEVNTDRIIRSLSAEILTPDEPGDDASELSVFILGMPRSGTTLVEQILDSHPEVAGAGEINDLWRIVNQVDPYMPP